MNEIKNMRLITIFIVYLTMQKIVNIETRVINKKNYLVPEYELFGCEKYMLPKLDNAPVHHYFFNPHDIDQLYKQQNFNPDECNLKNIKPELNQFEEEDYSENYSCQPRKQSSQIPSSMPKQQTKIQPKGKCRPKLRQQGPTHFIHIPLSDLIGQDFDNLIRPQIQESELDVLVDRNSLHATILTFRIKSEDDIPKWQKIVKSVNLKKAKVYMKGADYFPVKKTFTNVIYLNINGLDDIIDTVVSKGIQEGLINERQLSFISFDRQSQTYKAEKQHVTILKTKGKDLIDAAPFMKAFGKVNFGKISINKIAMSIVGSQNQNGCYFNEFVHEAL